MHPMRDLYLLASFRNPTACANQLAIPRKALLFYRLSAIVLFRVSAGRRYGAHRPAPSTPPHIT